MISQFTSCAAGSVVPERAAAASESAPWTPASKDSSDFRNAFSQAVNAAGPGTSQPGASAKNDALPASGQGARAKPAPNASLENGGNMLRGTAKQDETVDRVLPANDDGGLLNSAPAMPSLRKSAGLPVSNSPIQIKTSLEIPPKDGNLAEAATKPLNAAAADVTVQPKAAKSTSDDTSDGITSKARRSSKVEVDVTALIGGAALLTQPSPGTALPSAPAKAANGNSPAPTLTIDAKTSDTAGRSADAPVPVGQTSAIPATPLPALDSKSNNSSPQAPPSMLKPSVEASPSVSNTPVTDGKNVPAPPDEDQKQAHAIQVGLQPIDSQGEAIQFIAQKPAENSDGMGVALNDQRMKSAVETNEIAGPTGPAGQKLPRTVGNRASQPASDSDSAAKPASSANLLRKAEISVLPAPINIHTESISTNLQTSGGTIPDNTATVADGANRVEQVARLITQEVAMVRQSGATSLAVSLKVDPHTELFVQLTSHNGQIQASVRCERGSLAGLDGHWGQLQDSLGRQNVQLLPLQDRGSSRNTFAGTNSDAGTSRHFDRSSQDQQATGRELRSEPAMAAADRPARSRKTGSKNSGRQGWETWA